MSYGHQSFDINQIKICYQILELESGVSWSQVKQAYKELALVWHPDRFTHNPKLQQKAQERLKRINQAYEILKAYYRQQHASASKSVAEPPPPPPHKQSTNFSNATSTDKKTTKEATLSLNPKHINTELKGILTMPNYLALVSMFLPQFILAVMLTFVEKSTNNSESQNSTDALTGIFLFLAYVFAWLSGEGAIAYYSYQKLKNKSTTISEAINESIKKFPQFIGGAILYCIIVIMGIIVFIIPGIYLGLSLLYRIFSPALSWRRVSKSS